jgi:dolichyl-phosphate-mannose-protein mannosyltransferase
LPGPPPVRQNRPLERSFRITARYPHVLTCCGIFAVAFGVFHVDVASPSQPYFDETHYVPAAQSIFTTRPLLNAEHPPLAKELIAVGIILAGDSSTGWRLMSGVFGAMALVGVYVWSLQLFSNQRAALWVVLVSLVNQGIYVQSRIAMLDIFLLTFLIWALAFFSLTWNSIHTRRMFAGTGVCLGLAAACKWSALAAWMMVIAIVAGIKIFQRFDLSLENPSDTDWYRGDLWQRMRVRDWFLTLAVLPFAAYFMAFVLEYGTDVGAIFERQVHMWDLVSGKLAAHSYMSRWLTWPLMIRPVWYLWDANFKPNLNSAVVFLSNPLIAWAGLLAVFVCLYDWLVLRRRQAFVIFAAWFSMYAFWGLAPRAVTFSYYYLPSLTVLSLALAYVFYETPLARFVWLRRGFAATATALFIYFLPLTTAAIGVTQAGFNHRMWLRTWP